MKKEAGAPLIALVLLLSRCATVASGRLQPIEVVSDPSGADVDVDCGVSLMAKTPATVLVLRKADPCRFTIRLSGYETRLIELDRGFSRWYWVNLAMASAAPLAILGETFNDDTVPGAVGAIGIAGLFVDQKTGAAFDHDGRVDVKLEKSSALEGTARLLKRRPEPSERKRCHPERSEGSLPPAS